MKQTLPMIDRVYPDGEHVYWSTHCRHALVHGLDHAGHQACMATELAPGVLRQPAQCKACGAPCQCPCHPNRPGKAADW